ncbi:MAG: alpha/beta hydrolase-fold protein [Lachnospiraceae bacterium]|nr:alpha/beta hydrolase-fold protein [Lachnospiraceae bacterium]
MKMQYEKQYSNCLGREMEFKIYGHAGKAMLYIPCQNGRFFDFENFGMAETLAPWIEAGKLQVFSVDTLDAETWSSGHWDCRERISRHEQWFHYLIDEVVPQMISRAQETNREEEPKLMVFGCSMGAMHAGNLFFRHPDLFDMVLALSGVYNASFSFGDYMDELVYQNSPVHYLSNLPKEHEYRALYKRSKMVFCVGQGAWEDELLAGTRELDTVLARQDIAAWVDYWGYDVNHDWYWWRRQVEYFMPFFLQ